VAITSLKFLGPPTPLPESRHQPHDLIPFKIEGQVDNPAHRPTCEVILTTRLGGVPYREVLISNHPLAPNAAGRFQYSSDFVASTGPQVITVLVWDRDDLPSAADAAPKYRGVRRRFLVRRERP
jgi:hypothetical protein